jgi:8-oxo-dGTP diphosphatase
MVAEHHWRDDLRGQRHEHHGDDGIAELSGFAAAAVITDALGRVLFVRHSYGELNWEIPGGAGETGESAVDAAIREVREETGLDVTAERMTGVYYEPATRCHHFVFTCRARDSRDPAPSSPEITDVRWCRADDLPRPISDFTAQRIADALNGGEARLHQIGPRVWLR